MLLEDRAKVTSHQRTYTLDDVEIRSAADGTLTFEGVASVVGKPYEVRDAVGSYMETIAAGAFDKTLSELRAAKSPTSDFGLFVEHNWRFGALPLASVRSGRLEVWADPNLRVRATLNPARPSVQELRHAVTDGDVSQMSIGWESRESRSVWNAEFDSVTRTEVMAREASVVWQGSNPYTSGKVRSALDLLGEYVDVTDADELRAAIAHLSSHLDLLAPAPAGVDDQRAALRSALWAKRPI